MRKIILFILIVIIFNNCDKDKDTDPAPAQTTTTPTVQTKEATDITASGATLNGEITTDGGAAITQRGFYWSQTNTTPSATDNVQEVSGTTGTYTHTLIGLQSGITYYYTTFATNSLGTAVGEAKIFKTKIPRVTFSGETIFVEGGTFQMGRNDSFSDQNPMHDVRISNFTISKYEVTNAQYAAFMNAIGANRDGSVDGTEYLDMDSQYIQISYSGGQFVVDAGLDNYPVIDVTWYGAKAFCEWVGGRLPTEAEWEFAAKGGNLSRGYTYSGSNNLDEVAWYGGNSNTSGNSNLRDGQGTFPVGLKAPNELGIHDMSGNVWEWCQDWYRNDYYSNSPSDNPQGPDTTGGYRQGRVIRGGYWGADGGSIFNVTFRWANDPKFSSGFRPVFVP